MEKRNKYVGLRYVPKVMGEWDKTKEYEPLMVVTYQGNSYTSKTFIPVGIDISNESFWCLTGNYNAQVEILRQDFNNNTKSLEDEIHSFKDKQDSEYNELLENHEQKVHDFINEITRELNQEKENIEKGGLTELNQKVTSINNNILEKNNIKPIYLATFFDNDVDVNNYLYTSQDGINFKKISKKPSFQGRDSSLLFYNNKFYCIVTQKDTTYDFSILESENLIDWEEHKIDIGLHTQNKYVWSGNFFTDSDGTIYITISKCVGTMTDSVNNKSYSDFRPFLIKVSDLENYNFSEPVEIKLNSYNYIDTSIVKKDNIYYLFAKKERNEKGRKDGDIEIWKSSDFKNWTNVTVTIDSIKNNYFEGVTICKVNDCYHMYLDNYHAELGGFIFYLTSYDLEHWSKPTQINCNYLNRHGSVIKLEDTKEINILNNYINNSIENNSLSNLNNKILCRTTNTCQNNFIEFLKLKTNENYKSISIVFNVYDVQNNFIDCDYLLTIQRKGVNDTPNITLSVIRRKNNNNSYNKLISVINNQNSNSEFSLIFNVDTIGSCTPSINILSINNFGFDIEEVNNILQVKPVGTEFKCDTNYFVNGLRPSQNFLCENNEITFKCHSLNGIIKVKGHNNGILERDVIDLNIASLNGTINSYSLKDTFCNPTITLVDYSNNIYTIKISNLSKSAILDIELPLNSYFC